MSPGDKHFWHISRGDKNFLLTGATNIIYTQGGTNIFYTKGVGKHFLYLREGDKHLLYIGGINIFLMMMIIVDNVSGANILSSEVRKPPAGLEFWARRALKF